MADMKLNAQEWTALSKDDQSKIAQVLRTSGLLGEHDNIVADSNIPATAVLGGGIKASGIFCKIGCDIAEAAAVAACGTLSGPAAAVCIAAAHAAGELCRSKC